MKENYESMKLLLGKIKCDEFKWKLCGDLKVFCASGTAWSRGITM